MEARRTSGSAAAVRIVVMAVLAAAVALVAVAGTVSPATAAAGPGSRSAPAPATTASRPWTFAGRSCRLLSTASPLPVANGEACPGVRPGAPVLTPVGQCTLNFLWRATDGREYIGTAGHCLLDGTSQRQAVYPTGGGPLARDSAGHPIGEFAYAALDDVSDFALIRLDPGVAADPEICRLGGPTGYDPGPLTLLTPLQHVGRGSLTGSLVPARTQLAVDGGGVRALTGLGVASPGDSGSPVVGPDGKAVGVLVATGPVLPLLPAGLFVYSVRIGPEMGRAGAAMGLGFDLVTTPLRTSLLQP